MTKDMLQLEDNIEERKNQLVKELKKVNQEIETQKLMRVCNQKSAKILDDMRKKLNYHDYDDMADMYVDICNTLMENDDMDIEIKTDNVIRVINEHIIQRKNRIEFLKCDVEIMEEWLKNNKKDIEDKV